MKGNHQASALAILCAIGAASLAFAQAAPSLSGTYSGTFTRSTNRGPIVASAELTIDRVEGDAVTATAKQGNGDCRGSYALEGKREGDHLTLHVKSKEARAGCTFELDLTIQGEQLVGKKDTAEIKLSR